MKVGPVVDNAYGNAVSLELGSRIGVKLARFIALEGTVAVAPFRFSSSSTLFGKYWAQAPYDNDYYIRYLPIRAEGTLRFLFN